MNFVEIVKNLADRIAVLERNQRVTFLKLSENGTFILPVWSSAPSSPVEGQIYYNSSDQTVYVYDGSGWFALN